MSRDSNRKKAGDAAPRGWRGPIVFLLTLVVVTGLVQGIKWLGDSARRDIGPRDRYEVRFTDIECDAPPGYERVVFLAEVSFVSKFPRTFQSLDPELKPKLTAAFTKHPWVAAVEDVSVEPPAAVHLAEPPATVRVKLTFRVPALVVNVRGSRARVVDTKGVLLPSETETNGLPELVTPVPPTATPSGQLWPDDTVKRAVELVEAHHPRKLEKTPTGWRLTMPDGKTVVVER